MPKSKKSEQCNVEGCESAAMRQGICAEHTKKNYILACTLEGCDKQLYAKGMCKMHHTRKLRRKNGESAPPLNAPARSYGIARFEVFTRIPLTAAKAILKAAGRRDSMYEKAQQILTDWAEQHAAG